MALLRRFLTPEQQRQLQDAGAFLVTTPSGVVYELTMGRSGNLYRLERTPRNGFRRTTRYCVHPGESVPTADTLLAQKLWLETDEAGLLAVANRPALERLEPLCV